MLENVITISPEEIDARAKELITEFQDHLSAVRASGNPSVETDIIFRGWAFQKIAYLQLCVIKFQQVFNDQLADDSVL